MCSRPSPMPSCTYIAFVGAGPGLPFESVECMRVAGTVTSLGEYVVGLSPAKLLANEKDYSLISQAECIKCTTSLQFTYSAIQV